MSTAAAGARREWWPILGHVAWKVEMVVCSIYVVVTLLTLPFPANSLLNILRALALGIYAAVMVPLYQHDRILCERCAANFPLDPQAEIVNHRRALRVIHVQMDTPLPRRLVYIALIMVAVTALTLIAPEWLFVLLSAAIWGAVGVGFTWATQQHKRLQPWCPQCHHGGRGPRPTFNPEPTPAPSKELTS